MKGLSDLNRQLTQLCDIYRISLISSRGFFSAPQTRGAYSRVAFILCTRCSSKRSCIVPAMTAEFLFLSAGRGHHIYKSTWQSSSFFGCSLCHYTSHTAAYFSVALRLHAVQWYCEYD